MFLITNKKTTGLVNKFSVSKKPNNKNNKNNDNKKQKVKSMI